jgi:hypothetical protein
LLGAMLPRLLGRGAGRGEKGAGERVLTPPVLEDIFRESTRRIIPFPPPPVRVISDSKGIIPTPPPRVASRMSFSCH